MSGTITDRETRLKGLEDVDMENYGVNAGQVQAGRGKAVGQVVNGKDGGAARGGVLLFKYGITPVLGDRLRNETTTKKNNTPAY